MAKHAGGRPSDYSPQVLTKAEAYLQQCVDSFDEYVRTKNSRKGATEWRSRLVVKLPSIAGLAIYLGVGRSRVYDWAKAHPEFQDMLERILAEQEKRVLENGLSGEYNATIAKLVLAKHGYRDEQDITSGGETITGLTNEDRDALSKLHDILKQ